MSLKVVGAMCVQQDWMAAVARLHVAVFGEAATDGEAGPVAADAPSPSRTLSAGASAGGKVQKL